METAGRREASVGNCGGGYRYRCEGKGYFQNFRDFQQAGYGGEQE